MRNRAGIILWCKSKRQLLLIKRIKNDKSYWVIPGGGVKKGESFEAAAKRELYEEIRFNACELNEFVTLYLSAGTEKYYAVTMEDTCEFTIHGEEAKRSNDSNQYIPKWISIDELNDINLLPPEVKEHISENLYAMR